MTAFAPSESRPRPSSSSRRSTSSAARCSTCCRRFRSGRPTRSAALSGSRRPRCRPVHHRSGHARPARGRGRAAAAARRARRLLSGSTARPPTRSCSRRGGSRPTGAACSSPAGTGEERTFAVPGALALELAGLPHDDAAQLLGPEPVSRAVAEILVRATEGNPLALLEARRLLSAGQLAGREPLPDPLPAGETIERALMKRVEALPRTQRALLLASTSASMSVEAVLLARPHVGLEESALEAAEDAGLLLVAEGRLTFRHRSCARRCITARRRGAPGCAPAFGEALSMQPGPRRERGTWPRRRSARTRRSPLRSSAPRPARSGAPATRPLRGR